MTEVERTVMFTMPNLLSGQIACIAGTTAGRSWELGAGTFTIGRLDEHDLCLANEPGVSKTHAKIVAQGDRYVLVDCESRNGTILNGTNIQKAEIYDGDEIRICGCVLRFQQTGGAPRPKKPAPERTQTDISLTSTSSRPAMPAANPTATFQQPPLAAPPASVPAIVAAPVAAPPPVGRILAGWYAAGFAMSIVLGGAGSAALALTAPEATPVPAVAATPVAAPTAAPAAVAPAIAAPAAATNPAPTGGAAIDASAAAAVDAGTPASPPPEPTAAVEPAPVDVAPTAPDPPPTTRRERAESTRTPRVAAAGARYPATVDGNNVESVRTKTGGKVASVDVADGATVTRGQRLVTFDTGGDPGEIQTLQDRIASLENADDEEAKRDLKSAKQRLAALEAGRGAPPIVAGSDGKLTGFNVVVGAVLKAGEVVGKIGDGDVPTRVRVTVGAGVRIKTGHDATLILKSGGTASGSVVSVSGRNVVVDTGAVAGDAVDAVEF